MVVGECQSAELNRVVLSDLVKKLVFDKSL